MELYEKILKRIEADLPIYDNIEYAKDLEAIAEKHYGNKFSLHVVGCSDVTEPYLKCEKQHQLLKMEKLGINTKNQLFEQCVNGLIFRLMALQEKE